MSTRPLIKIICAIWLFVVFDVVALAQGMRPSQPSIRRDVATPAPQASYVLDSLQLLFQGHVRTAVERPNRLELGLSSGSVNVEYAPSLQLFRVEGPAPLANDIANLINALGKKTASEAIRILPLNDRGQDSLRQSSVVPTLKQPIDASVSNIPAFIGIRKTQLASTQLTPTQTQQPPQNQPLGPGVGSQSSSIPNMLGESSAISQGANRQQKGQPPGSLPLPQFEGVQIEMLPEIDAIILRGRDQQLNDLSEIIRQLDEASKLTRAEIEVVPLQHANSESVAKLLTKTIENLTGSRQGRVTITPLGKPNALLLIGWGDAMQAAKDLVTKLDLPVAADIQFSVIQLKHASAIEIQTQLKTFFQSREGLGPVIQSMVDSRTNAIVVHASPRDLDEIRMLIEKLDVPRGAILQQARVFPMKHSLATDVAASLKLALTSSTTGPGTSVQLLDKQGQPVVTSGVLGASQITVNDRNNSIVVSSSPENLPLIEKLIEQLDTPGMIAKIKIFPVKNSDATALVETLRSLLQSSGPTSQTAPQLSNAPDETSLLPLRFTVDSRSNNIIVVGSEGDLKIVEALILRLDESDSMQRKSTVYQLKNSPAVDVALAINEFLRSKRVVENAAPGTTNPFDQLEKEVVVVPEPVQNKLIMSATPRYYDEISRLIEQLDQQPPQVMIQVMIAEISLGNTDEFGIEMGLQDSVLFDRSLLGGLVTRPPEIVAASNTPGFNFNSTDPLGNSGSDRAIANANAVGGQGISNFSVGRTNKDLGFGGLVLSASSENVSFLLRALQDSKRIEILSRPQVLTLDNQQAFIQVGQRVPRIASSTLNQIGSQNNIVLENVGLIIGVTPRISPEGNVVMEIDAEKSKLGPDAEGIPVSISNNGTIIRSPRIDTITAQATVSAADGETIILGGLISRSVRSQHRQVPWLGSLPILKYLFSYDFNETLRTELLIIMTPNVIRNQGDMERLKQAEFARMSWCEADVFDIHGDVYPKMDVSNEALNQEGLNVVYPDVDPRGVSEPPAYSNPGVGQPAVGSPVPSDPMTPPANGNFIPQATRPSTKSPLNVSGTTMNARSSR